jgi:hypothetical protein
MLTLAPSVQGTLPSARETMAIREMLVTLSTRSYASNCSGPQAGRLASCSLTGVTRRPMHGSVFTSAGVVQIDMAELSQTT